MATTAVRNGRRIALTVEQKARSLHVFEIGEPGRLAVSSGTNPNNAYVVRYVEGHHETHYCPCNAVGYCPHRQAADWYLEAQQRHAYDIAFNPNGVL